MKRSFKQKKHNRIVNRILSIIIAAVIMLDGLYAPGVQGIWEFLGALPGNVRAAAVVGEEYPVTSLRALYEFSAQYHNDADFAAAHDNCDLVITMNDAWALEDSHEFTIEDSDETENLTYYPLGTSAYPFAGRVRITQVVGNYISCELNVPMFDYILDSVEIVNNSDADLELALKRNDGLGSSENEALFAQHVVHDERGGATPATWLIMAGQYDAAYSFDFSGVLGTVHEDAIVNLTFENLSSASTQSSAMKSTGDVGLICGVIEDNASVNVTISGTNTAYSVKTTGGAAGGLVGVMESGSSLTVALASYNDSVYNISASKTIEGTTYAGGLVGYCNGGTVTIQNEDLSAALYTATGTITGSTAAGGIFGYYANIADETIDLSTKYAVSGCTVKANVTGGLFGVLVNDADLLIQNGTVSITSSQAGDSFGGLVGEYHTNDLKHTLEVSGVTANTSATESMSVYGGVTARIKGDYIADRQDAAAYLKVNNFTHVSTAGYYNESGCFGGVVGDAGTMGSMLDVGSVTISTKSGNNAAKFFGGGIVGKLVAGVLRLSGITDMTNAPAYTATETARNKNRGQLVGIRLSALVYALGSGEAASASYGSDWRFVRSAIDARADDIGTWGEVVRIAGVEGESGALTFNGTNPAAEHYHQVVVKAAATSMAGAMDFTKTALNMQLNDGEGKGALCFADTNDTSKSEKLLANESLTITANIDLRGTGITGFMRDDYDDALGSTGDVGDFKGTLTGTGQDITLAVGERYGIYDPAGGDVHRGAIVAHRYNGLFARTQTGAKVKGINIKGEMNVNSMYDYTYVGGVAAAVKDGIILTDVSVSESIVYKQISGEWIYIGGMIGLVGDTNSQAITINKSEGSADVRICPTITVTGNLGNDGNNEWRHSVSGAIGYVQSVKPFKITVNDVLLSATVDASGATSVGNMSVTGLISDIKWNGDGDHTKDTRTLDLKNIEVKGTTVKSNATNNTGGLLGYRWFSTIATIDNVHLEMDGEQCNELKTSAAYVGGLVNKAGGYWTIPSGGIKINAFNANITNRSANSSRSFGLILNDAYYSNTGLFMDFTAADSYTIAASNVDVSALSGYTVYDEIVAFTNNTGNYLVNGKHGIVSITTTSGVLSMDEATCNTYQNKYNVSVTNPYTRYYYNLNAIRTKVQSGQALSDGEKLLLWSVWQYAGQNLRVYFTDSDGKVPFSGGTISGDFDMRGLSYYPVDISSGISLGDITVKFYNAEIEATESAASGNTDGHVRSTRSASQHTLMHCGLFKNVTNTVNINGDIRLKGTIGTVVDTNSNSYSGALVCGKISSTVKPNYAAGSPKDIVLEGITVSGSGGKYLLINQITTNGKLTLSRVRTGGGKDFNNVSQSGAETAYATGVIAADSLIGNANGTSIQVEFSKIKLDSRVVADSVDSDLNDIYGTTRSIFSKATLLNAFAVDANSIGVYNYNEAEDWSGSTHLGNVTYGWEIIKSEEYEDEEMMYYDQRSYTSPVSASAGSEYTDFGDKSIFRPYVSEAYEYGTYRELKVNVRVVGLTEGCGTYNHPYVIIKGSQLATLAKTINGTAIPESLRLPKVTVKNADDRVSLGDNKKHRCLDEAECAEFTYSETNKRYEYKENTTTYYWDRAQVRHYLAGAYYLIDNDITITAKDNYPGLGAPATDGTQGQFSFRGVIVGSGSGHTITNRTKRTDITDTTNANTMGLITMSNGSVIKNLTIKVELQDSDLYNYKSNENIAYAYDEKFPNYGAVINKVMGGDNIIDNVRVQYVDKDGGSVDFKVLNANDYKAVVGGYVGVVVNGGLIFRNIENSYLTGFNVVKVDAGGVKQDVVIDDVNLTDGGKNLQHGDDLSHLYVNPFVGRVINGYAFLETEGTYAFSENGRYGDGTTRSGAVLTTLKNTTKNYSIPNINKNAATKLTFTQSVGGGTYDTVEVPDGQAMYILSAITQSGSGAAATDTGNYAVAISCDGNSARMGTADSNKATHKAMYSDVGVSMGSVGYDSTDYDLSTKDTINSRQAVPYIIYHYTGSYTADNGTECYPARTLTQRTFFIKLKDGARTTYYLPDSFRGIGYIGDRGDQNNAMTDNMKIYGFDGKDHTIDINTLLYCYEREKDTYYNKNTGYIYTGVALFNHLNQYNSGSNAEYESERAYQIGHFTLTGYISGDTRKQDGTEYANIHDNGSYSNNTLYAAGVVSCGVRNDAGYEKYYNFADIDLNDLHIRSMSHAGGLMSRVLSGKIYINNCNADGLTVEGGARIGGFVGTADSKAADSGIHINVNVANAKSVLEDIVIKQTDNGTNSYNYAGGIIGSYFGDAISHGNSITEDSDNYASVLIRNVTISGGDPEKNFIGSAYPADPQGYAGGIIGNTEKAKGCLILDCSVEDINIYGRYAGGITAVTGTTNTSTFARLRTVGCTIKAAPDGSGNPQYTIKGACATGGVIGQNYDNAADFDPIFDGKEYTVPVDDCLVEGYIIEQTVAQDYLGAGGIAGVNKVNTTMANVKVKGCDIICNGSRNTIGSGGIIGSLHNNWSLSAYNIAVEGNTFDNNAVHVDGVHNNIAPYGNLIGRAYSNNVVKVVGYTAKDNEVVKGFGTNRAEDIRAVEFETGRFWDHSKTNTFLSNFYTTASCYIVYADFNATCSAETDKTGRSIASSGLTSYADGEDSVESPGLFPYVTSSPQASMGTGEVLTGDGALIDAVTDKPVARTILDADSSDDKYYNTSSADNTVVTAMIPANDESEQDVKLTTYQTEMETLPANVDDFTILALGGAADGGLYTNQITSYIRLLTNTSYDYTADVAGVYRIRIYPCQYIGGKYKIVEGNAGLSRDNSNRYVMKESNADTLQSNHQFTLIDVQYYNPFDSDEIAYHLYVPVLTKKMIKYNFRSSALEKTEYEQTRYPQGNKLAGNFDSWITMYVRYEYTQADINAILATGRGLSWNNDKAVNLQYSIQQDVADSTQFVLLDNNNNADKEYYLTKASVETTLPMGGNATDRIDLSDFTAKDDVGFATQTLNDIAGTKLVYTNDAEAENRVYTPTDAEDEDVVLYAYDSEHGNKLYFKKADGTEAENEKYAVTVTGTVTESYYLSMYTYGSDNVYSTVNRTNNAYMFTVTGPATMDGTIPIKRNIERNATVFLGNLFDQTLTITELTEETRISPVNHVLTATLTSEVSFRDSENKSFFQNMLNAEGITLYQGFMVYLNRYDADNELDEDQTIKGAPDYTYTIRKDGGAATGESSSLEENASGLYVEPVEISIPSYSSNPDWSSVQTAQVTFTFSSSDTDLQREFPIRNDEASRAGISFYASANLAYSADQVKYSAQTCKRADDTKRYYMDKQEKLDLTLTALDQEIDDGYDHLGEQSRNRSSLGINAKYIDTGLKFGEEGYHEHIDAAANLDVSQLPDTITEGEYALEFDLELRQKQDTNNESGYQYQRVSIDTYLQDFEVRGKSGALTPVSTADGVYKYRIELTGASFSWPIEYVQQQFNARVSFDVKTGSELESITGYLYSNYKLTMNAKIVKSDNPLEGYEGDPDSIVYTNAKINAQYVTPTD